MPKTARSPRPSGSSVRDSATVDLESASHNNGDLARRPWRREVTPVDTLLAEDWEGEGTEAKPYIVGWMTKDVENPQTWTNKYKWFVTGLVSFTTMVVALASSTYSGAIPDFFIKFPGYSTTVYIAGLSVFVLGFAIGPVFWAPLSEVFGRRNLFIISYILFTCFNAGLVGSQNIETVIILRFFSGASGSSPLTNAGGTISDIFGAEQRGIAMAIFSSAPFLGPALGPIIGGFLGEAAGFRWVFAFIAILTGILTVVGVLWIPETYGPVLLRQRAARLSKLTGKVYRSAYEKDKPLVISDLFKTALTRPWKLLFTEPIVILLSIYMAIIYGTLYLLFAAFPIVYEQNRGWSVGVSGLAFLGVLVGFLSGVAYYIFYENPRYVRVANKHDGFAPPESRLLSAMIGGICMPAGIFWFAWTAYPVSIHWIVSIIATVPFGFGMVLVFLSVSMYLVDSYLIYAASVLAANSVLRSLFGAAFPLFTTEMYDALGVNWASTLVGFLALACAPMPFLFARYGRAVRTRCKYAKEAAGFAQMMKDRALRQRELEEAPGGGEKASRAPEGTSHAPAKQEGGVAGESPATAASSEVPAPAGGVGAAR